MKKILSVLLVAIMIFSMIALTASGAEVAVSGSCGENLTWVYNDFSKTLTISGTGEMYDYAEDSSQWEYTMEKVVIEDGVTSIGDYAFYYYGHLESVTIPESVTSIGDWSFFFCDKITDITIPDGVKTIGDSAFGWCRSLTSVTIPDNVEVLDAAAFIYCTGLESITIGKGVTSIGTSAFSGCWSLKNITVSPENQAYSSDNQGVLFNKDKTLLIYYPQGSQKTSYEIPDGTKHIEEFAFSECGKLESITVPVSIEKIGASAFNECDALTDVYYAGTEEEWNAISIVGGVNDTLLDANIHYNHDVDEDSGVTWSFNEATGELTISGMGAMTDYAEQSEMPWYGFYKQIKSVVIEDGITEVGQNSFNFCYNITNVSIPESVKVIDNCAFYYCSGLESVAIPKGVETIGDLSFYACESLTFVMIPDNVITIGNNAFTGCMNLEQVYVGSGVTSIGKEAFDRCQKLEYIEVYLENEAFSNDEYGVLFDKNKTKLLQYPPCRESYSYRIPDGVTTIGVSAFAWSENLTEIIIPVSVTNIEDFAFQPCENISDVYYTGTPAQWSAIKKGLACDSLLNATIHYNYSSDNGGDSPSIPHTHSYSSAVTTEPGCETTGVITYSCACGNSYTRTVEVKGHSFGDWQVEKDATIDEPGTKVRTCSECGTTEEENFEMTFIEEFLYYISRGFELIFGWFGKIIDYITMILESIKIS